MNLNSVNVMGNLTRDPEMKQIPSGKTVCNLAIVNNRTYMKNSDKIVEVSYFDVEVWGVAGENCAKYLTKGSGVIVEGKLKQERWEKDGKAHSHVRITADAVHFLPKKRKNDEEQASSESSSKNTVLDEVIAGVSARDFAWED